MGPGCTVNDSVNVSQNGTENNPLEDQVHGLKTRFHLGEVGGESAQVMGDWRRINVLGEEEVASKLHQVWRDSGTILSQTAHGEPTWYLHSPDKRV